MKKNFFIFSLILIFTPFYANALSQEEIINKHLSNRSLDLAEGVWAHPKGRVFAIYKSEGKYFFTRQKNFRFDVAS